MRANSRNLSPRLAVLVLCGAAGCSAAQSQGAVDASNAADAAEIVDGGAPDGGGWESVDGSVLDSGVHEDADAGDAVDAGERLDAGGRDGGEQVDGSTALKGFGEACADDAECTSVVCFLFGDGSQVCTIHCASAEECPVGSAGQKCNKQGVCKP